MEGDGGGCSKRGLEIIVLDKGVAIFGVVFMVPWSSGAELT